MKWNHTVNVVGPWQKAENNEITASQLAGELVTALEKLPKELLSTLDMLDELREFSNESPGDDDEFDDLFDDVYAWADNNSVWIKTF